MSRKYMHGITLTTVARYIDVFVEEMEGVEDHIEE